MPHPAENVQPVHGCSSAAGASIPATARPVACGSVVVRPVYYNQLWEEIILLGYQGSYGIVSAFAGLTLPLGSGVVEGHVNRIKMLKRQMFGRAGFAFLRKRVLA
ncbi:hypothetical protein [Streptomyces sp. AC555_RSS877]|uniref:hypothetical protein n=1 Tax=Streptomyces sp. AC555_RSS877 TaxID=2823688 RepID=UPI001C251F57|nr:hypothetical protein [Streptomyces sp. AC555_RSS877]